MKIERKSLNEVTIRVDDASAKLDVEVVSPTLNVIAKGVVTALPWRREVDDFMTEQRVSNRLRNTPHQLMTDSFIQEWLDERRVSESSRLGSKGLV